MRNIAVRYVRPISILLLLISITVLSCSEPVVYVPETDIPVGKEKEWGERQLFISPPTIDYFQKGDKRLMVVIGGTGSGLSICSIYLFEYIPVESDPIWRQLLMRNVYTTDVEIKVDEANENITFLSAGGKVIFIQPWEGIDIYERY